MLSAEEAPGSQDGESVAAPRVKRGRRRRGPRSPGVPTIVTEPREGFTAVGRVLRAHGIRGELRVFAFATDAPNLQKGCRVYVDGVERRVTGSRPDRGAWLIQLTGVSDRTQAETLANLLVEAADADVRRTDEDSYFVYELIGLRVVTDAGREVGTISEVLQGPANDVYVATGPLGEVLIPAVGAVVASIDLGAGVVVITPLPGLLDESK